MKVIDLLNKIANGKVPKKIKINNREWKHDGIDYKRESDEEYLFSVFLETTTHDLNMEVEIIEEDKKIEKLNELNNESDESKRLRNKINELIDEINKLKEDK